MKISCIYCGATVDTKIESVCPNCGADISSNERYQQYVDMQNNMQTKKERLDYEKEQEELKRKSIENERLQNRLNVEKSGAQTSKAIRIGCLIPIILFIAVLCVSICLAVIDIAKEYEQTEPSPSVTDTTYVETFYEVDIGENVSTQYYDLVLDKWDYFTPKSYSIQSGMKYIKFHFVYKNTTTREIHSNEPIRCYDENGLQCDQEYSIFDEDQAVQLKAQWVRAGSELNGWFYFEIPESTNEVDVTYGDYIEIHINLMESANEES